MRQYDNEKMDAAKDPEIDIMKPAFKFWTKHFSWIQHICVEPTMWLYLMAYMITSVIELAFFVHKACRVDHGYSEELCATINTNKTLKAEVQITVSEFNQWNNIIGHVIPILLSFFYGNWSDHHGRKLPLLVGLFGKFIYSSMIIVNTLMDNWNLNMVLWTATFPMGLLGGDVTIFGSCFAYISDVSTIEQRTFRITILDVVYLSAMPIGIAIGSYLFNNVVNGSYTIMFTINASLLALAMLYSLLNLKWQTSEQQRPLSTSHALTEFFDKEHVVATIRTLSKTRRNHGRLYLWLVLIAMGFYTFQRDEKPMSYLYTQLMFKWDVTAFSKFRTFQSALFVIAMLVGAPLLSKVLKLSDALIVAIGAISHASGRVVFALARVPELFYLGAVVAAIGPVVASSLRSMISKLVPVVERGKVFAVLSVFDNATPLFSGILYNQLYKATINTAPYAIYWLTFGTQMMVLFLVLVIYFSSESKQLNPEDYIDDNSTVNSACPSVTEELNQSEAPS